MTTNPHVGSSFESFLEEEGILEECTQAAIERVLARQIDGASAERVQPYQDLDGSHGDTLFCSRLPDRSD
jgi:hypothetical protein